MVLGGGSEMTRLRFGLVGTGYWAREVHAAGLAAHPGLDLVGVYGRDLAKARTVADEHGAVGYDDLETFFAHVDAVSFAVPPAVQGDLALRAVEAGKHLFLEKPVALDVAAADRLLDAVEARSLSSVVFFTARFVPTWENWLTETIAWAPAGGRADWLTSDAGPDNPYAGSQWRRENGALWDIGPHMLAQLLPVLGPVTDVAGARGAGDLVHLVLTHRGGATSRMSLTQNMPPGVLRVGVEFYGDGGFRVQPDDERDVAAAYQRAVSELVDNIESGETRHPCDVRFARDIVAVLARCEDVLGTRSDAGGVPDGLGLQELRHPVQGRGSE